VVGKFDPYFKTIVTNHRPVCLSFDHDSILALIKLKKLRVFIDMLLLGLTHLIQNDFSIPTEGEPVSIATDQAD